MSLKKLRQKLATDQRNVITGTVTSTSTGRVTIRSDKNEIITALSSAGYVAGDVVQVRVDGQQREVIGGGLRSVPSGEVIHQFDSSGNTVNETYYLTDDEGNALVDDDGNHLLIF